MKIKNIIATILKVFILLINSIVEMVVMRIKIAHLPNALLVNSSATIYDVSRNQTCAINVMIVSTIVTKKRNFVKMPHAHWPNSSARMAHAYQTLLYATKEMVTRIFILK
jgi:hypothetical protein